MDAGHQEEMTQQHHLAAHALYSPYNVAHHLPLQQEIHSRHEEMFLKKEEKLTSHTDKIVYEVITNFKLNSKDFVANSGNEETRHKYV